MKTKEGLWKLSPSGLYTYRECKACFWLENHHKRPPMLPLLLNSAMDSILKARYDAYRKEGKFPPEAAELENRGLVPFTDMDKLTLWRENMQSLKIVNERVGYVMVGKIDDVLTEKDGSIVPADYKSSGNPPSADKQKYYQLQLAAYGLMFSEHGFNVSNRAFLLHYYVKDKNNPSLSVVFDAVVDEVPIDISAISNELNNMVALLEGPYPGDDLECEKCIYHAGRMKKKQ